MILGSWAKYAIAESSPTKYAYLGQYFETNAFKVDDDGNLTANTTGIVSPYGEFFPTKPGPAALITMPDIDTGIQATGIVQVISLALDANHDGTIETNFNGPDTATASNPYRFWVNNNFDRWAYDSDDATNYMDDVQAGDTSDTDQNLDPDEPDYNYKDNHGDRLIPDTRDLEDFARLWICGLTTNVLAALPAGSTVTLSWDDVGSPNANNPTIDLFQAADADGGIGYLTYKTIATQQIDPNQASYVGRIKPGGSLQLNANYFGSTWRGNHFIWCGVSNGTGGLTLTIADAHSNVLAKAKTYIQILDIKQMYERWTVGDDPSAAPDSSARIATNDLPAGIRPFRFAKPGNANTPYILYVHGWNMEAWEKDRFAESTFKRLYWQGYQGRFGAFHWPTGFGFGGWKSIITDPDNFDNSESNAWASGKGLLNKLNDLNSQYPGNVYMIAHSMGNVTAGEALRQAGTNQLVNTYISMQGAISAHCYDPNTPNRSVSYTIPDRYAYYWTSNSPCYFNGIAGAGAFANFYNANDYALNLWITDQDFKPDVGYQYSPFLDEFLRNVGLGSVSLHFPTNTYEIFSYADPARSYALGAQANVGGVFQKGGTPQQANLPDVWPPDPSGYTAHVWHSAEFRLDYTQSVLFWKTILQRFDLTP